MKNIFNRKTKKSNACKRPSSFAYNPNSVSSSALMVRTIEEIEKRPFYDVTYKVTFNDGSVVKIVRSDTFTEDASDIMATMCQKQFSSTKELKNELCENAAAYYD